MSPGDFIVKCSSQGSPPPLVGTVSDELLRNPDMFDNNGEPCTLVVKNGTGPTIGRANGMLSIMRRYLQDASVHHTSMECGIMNYCGDSELGDSGVVTADIRGRVGGMLTDGVGTAKGWDMTYATPWWPSSDVSRRTAFPTPRISALSPLRVEAIPLISPRASLNYFYPSCSYPMIDVLAQNRYIFFGQMCSHEHEQ